MALIGGIWLFILGALAAPNVVLAKRPDAKQVLARIQPYQGWIGAVSALWGAIGVVRVVFSLGQSIPPILWLTMLAVAIVLLGLGLLLGVGVLKSIVKSPEAHEKLDGVLEKISPMQGQLGIAAMGLAVWMIVASFIF